MPRGVPLYRTTLSDRERKAERKLSDAINLLYMIRDDLDPASFTRKEVRQEFCALTDEFEEGITTKKVLDADLNLLIEAGYIEEIEGELRVTEAGMALERKEEEQ